jgi:hypothetical protein
MMQVIDKGEFEPWMIAILEPLIAKLVAKVEIARIEPVLCSIEDACVITGRSPRFIIDGIARGLFVGKKSDGRTLLNVQSLKDYCASLPAAKGTLNVHWGELSQPRFRDARVLRVTGHREGSGRALAPLRERFLSAASDTNTSAIPL